MGQGPSLSAARARQQEVDERLSEAWKRTDDLLAAAAAEKAAGIPAGPGSKQALSQAAIEHFKQLSDERLAIHEHIIALIRNHAPPRLPERTPRWEEVEAALALAEPSTPAGSSSPARGQRSSGSSNEASVPAGDVPLGEAAPLLPGGAGPSATGLRRRPGRELVP